jgi:hypothetical protein
MCLVGSAESSIVVLSLIQAKLNDRAEPLR